MALKQCEKGHFYDPERHTICPSCGIGNLEIDATRPKRKNQPPPSNLDNQGQVGEPSTRGLGDPVAQRGSGETVNLIRKRTGMDPVVGWLVCIEGPDRGRDYRIRSERNFIGRDPSMDISISGDEAISRQKHASIGFDPKKSRFTLIPGESGRNLYLNDDETYTPTPLQAWDEIELGETKLVFIPLCGEKFQW